MQLLDIDAIVIADDRIRRSFDTKHIEELADSIAETGLLHAPVVRSDGQTLVAGETRLRAIQHLYASGRTFTFNGERVPVPQVPVTLITDLSEDALVEAELDENLKRKDLTWQEKAKAVKRLQDLRTSQAKARGDRPPSRSDLIRELTDGLVDSPAESTMHKEVREDLELAEAMSKPELAEKLAAAPDKKSAMKELKRHRVAEHRQRLAAEFDGSAHEHVVVNRDSLEWLPTLPEGSFEIILTDPPYGIGANDFGTQADAAHAYNDSAEWFEENMPTLAGHFSRLAARDAHLYMFCDLRWFSWLRKLLIERHSWDVFRTPLIWSKGNGMLPWPERGPRRTYEAILYAVRGDLPVTAVYPDVIDVPGLARPEFGAEKPARLYAEILKRSAQPGFRVLDPFAGTGGIVAACNTHSCIAYASELATEKYNRILERMNETASASALPRDGDSVLEAL